MPRSLSLLALALTAQFMGSVVALAVVELLYPELWATPVAVALIQGACTAFSSQKLGSPIWWIPLHSAFAPLLVMGLRLPIAPWWYLGVFLLLLLTFWRTDLSRVPLFLSSRATAESISQLIPPQPCSIIDLGCANGRFVKQLASLRPDCNFQGIEHAPLPWLWARINTIGHGNIRIRFGDFWKADLSQFEAVYAFLSPVPMPRLWKKAQLEMRPGSKLISNSFPILDTSPTKVESVADGRHTKLYVYQISAAE